MRGKVITLPCGTCGKAMDVWPSRLRDGGGKFCSRPCQHAARRAKALSFERDILPRLRQSEGCWEWLGSRGRNGYGRIRRNARTYLAHRLAYELAIGTIPDGMWVCHICDNPPCCRPDHLFLGSQGDNIRDAARKGRHRSGAVEHPERMARGERHWAAKLTEAQVVEIRARYLPRSVTLASLATEYGVSKSLISLIVRGEAWEHVT